MLAGLQQRRRTRQRPTAIDEVPGVLPPALGVPVEPRRAGGLGVLDPHLLLHSFRANTPVLARGGWLGQGAGSALLNSGLYAGLEGIVDHPVVGPAAVDVRVDSWAMPHHLSRHPGADERVLRMAAKGPAVAE